jgi:ribosomal protein S12 methylthiotransferase accessory factor
MIETLPPSLARAVSPYTGIVRSLEECLHLAGEPPLFRVACDVGDGERVLGGKLDHLEGMGGSGLTKAEAAAAGVGEALERYSATFVPEDRLVFATARELGEEAVEPERFALFSELQHATVGFPFQPFTSDTRVPWVRGVSLPGRCPAWLPAELVFLGDPMPDNGVPIGYTTSNGMACGETIEDALSRGLCELLERDAFMITWANKLSLPTIEWPEDSRLGELDARFFAPTGMKYAAVDLSSFHRLPTVLGVVRAPVGCPGAFGVGAGTASTVERAVWKALSEAFASRSAGAKLMLLQPERTYGRFGGGVRSFEDRIAYYADHGRAEAGAFLDSSADRIESAEIPVLPGDSSAAHVLALCERVESAGSSAYAVDVTSPDVRELGLTVTKVVAPELCPLEVAHQARFLGGGRLYHAAAALGLSDGPLRTVNPEPHPFP